MCGICGAVERAEGAAHPVGPTVSRMVNALRHRGPDADGERLFARPGDQGPSIGLGHTRLAIIDLSEAGREPMVSDDGQVALVYNGEVYNFLDHRQRLERDGRRFRSRTDSEVVLALYEERGEEMLSALDGMFALAVLDLKRGQLLLARDPLGIKPLFYAEGPPFLFASEPKAVLASGRFTREVDWQAVADYFTYLYVPHPQTAFRGLRELPPGHLLRLGLDSGAVRVEPFFRRRRRPELERLSSEEAQPLLRDTLSAAVRRQLMSDVPLGVFLSGGVDSSIVAGLAAQAGGRVRTLTVVFEEERLRFYDEREEARAASRHLGTEHEELVVGGFDPFDLLDDVAWFDQPFGNPTSHLLGLLCRRARPRVTVALCGAGGDELFAGYPRYRAHRLAALLRAVPRPLLRGVGHALRLLPDHHRGMGLRRAKEFFLGLDADPIRQFTNWTYFLDAEAKAALLGHAARGLRLDAERLLRARIEESALDEAGNRMLEMDVLSFLPDNLLAYTDRASMAAGLEVRVPLLDSQFVDLALNLPFALKLRGRATKAVLREAFAPLLAPGQGARGKRGFNAPLALWMSELDAYFDAPPALRDRFGPHLGESWRSGVLSFDLIQRLRQEHRRGRADHAYELFAIATFDRWWGTYIAA